MTILVHHLDFSRSMRVLWLLEELGLDYSLREWKRDANFRAPAEATKVHPLGRFPMVDVDGRVLAESGAILEYFATRESTLLPLTDDERLAYRFYMHYAEGSVMPPLLVQLILDKARTAPMPFFVRPIVKAITSEITKAYSGPAIDLHFAFIDAELGKRPYFAGDTFTAADIQMHYPVEAGLARGAGTRPNIEAWRARVTQRDAFKRAHDKAGRVIPQRARDGIRPAYLCSGVPRRAREVGAVWRFPLAWRGAGATIGTPIASCSLARSRAPSRRVLMSNVVASRSFALLISASLALTLVSACGDDDGTPQMDGGLSCGTGMECGGACIDPDSNAAHCGACDNACSSGQACVSGSCELSCPSALTECGTACVDTDSDRANCGACGSACDTDEYCNDGTCETLCPTTFMVCGGACVDTTSNPAHCGDCATVCGGGQVCSAGSCVATCGTGLVECSSACVDTSSSPDHCSGCDAACTYANAVPACAAGTCLMTTCMPGYADCDASDTTGCEVATASDNTNCGACGVSCGITESCNAGVCESTGTAPTTWKISSLGTDDCVGNPFQVIGDDRGGIATGRSAYYYIGDNRTGAYDYSDPNRETSLPNDDRVGIFSDLGTGDVYSLTEAGDPITDCATVDGFVKLDDALQPVGTVTALSVSFDTCGGGSPRGMFAGIGMMLQHDGTNTREINLSTGVVTDLGAGASLTGARSCEEWAIWGIAERFGSETYLVFRHSSTPDAILRRKVSDGTDEVILDLDALETSVGGNADASDICSISIAPSRGQWVYHGENVDSILGIAPEFGGGEETTGVCPAVFDAPAL